MLWKLFSLHFIQPNGEKTFLLVKNFSFLSYFSFLLDFPRFHLCWCSCHRSLEHRVCALPQVKYTSYNSMMYFCRVSPKNSFKTNTINYIYFWLFLLRMLSFFPRHTLEWKWKFFPHCLCSVWARFSTYSACYSLSLGKIISVLHKFSFLLFNLFWSMESNFLSNCMKHFAIKFILFFFCNSWIFHQSIPLLMIRLLWLINFY
jgi:hypothetical protein